MSSANKEALLNGTSEDGVVGAKGGVVAVGGGARGGRASVVRVRATGRVVKGPVHFLLEGLGTVGKTSIASGTGSTNAGAVRLAVDRRDLGKVRGLLGRSNGEDGALPLLTLPSEILELGGLGADATSEDDVLEERIVLSNSHVDLLVGSGLLDLLLLLVQLNDLLLGRREVALVEVLNVLRIGVLLKLCLGPLSLRVDGVQEGVGLAEGILDLLLKNLLESRTNDLDKQGLDNTEQHLVVGLLELDLEVLDINIHLGDLEEVRTVVLRVSRLGRDLEAETLSTQEDVGNTLVLDGREALLPVDIVADVTEVHLDARHRDHDLVLVLVRDLLAAPAPVVVAGKLENVGGEVVALNDKVLDDSIHLRIAVLDARDRDVPDVLEETGEDDLGNILKEAGLESSVAAVVLAKIVEQLVEGVGESRVLGISVELVAQELELLKDTVRVRLVTVTEEEVALIIYLVPLIRRSILQDVALLLEALADVDIQVLEPVLQLRIPVGVLVDLVDGIEQVVHGGAVRKTLNKRL